MMKIIVVTLASVLLTGVGLWYFSKKAEIQVTSAHAQTEMDPLQKEILDPTFADQTGFLESIQGRVNGKDVWIYNVHTVAGPISLAPQLRKDEELTKFHGSYVRLREAEKGRPLRFDETGSRFQFELVQPADTFASGKIIEVVVTPNLTGVRTSKVLEGIKKKGTQLLGPILGPECLSDDGHDLYPVFDLAVEEAIQKNIPVGEFTKWRLRFVSDESCKPKTFSTSGVSRYFTSLGDVKAQIIWTNEAASDFSKDESTSVSNSASRMTVVESGCDSLQVQVPGGVQPTVYAHQIGRLRKGECHSGICEIKSLNHRLPYLITAREGENVRVEAKGSWTCEDSSVVSSVKFVARKASSCKKQVEALVRTENLAAGSQVIVTAFGKNNSSKVCLATVNSDETVGLAKCSFEKLSPKEDYVLLAQYEKAHAWAFQPKCQ